MPDTLLNSDEREALPAALPAWEVTQTTLEREVSASTFLACIEWVVEIAKAAEALDHHPDIDIRWRTLRIVLTTHSAGGLTQRDVDLAHLIDAIVGT